MAEVKWVKITTDMFDNKKIRYLRTLPEGNNIVLIWVMLLTMAGRCNANGMIFLTENIPYTPKMLADELGFDVNIVSVALTALSQLGMIYCDDNEFFISNWEEYQNVEGMEKIREQNRIRKANQRSREKQALLEEQSRDGHVTSQQSHAIDKDIDIDKDIEINNIGQKRKRFVPPTVEEVEAYCKERNNGVDPQKFCDFYESKGWMVGKNKMKDWKAAIRSNWEKEKKNTKVRDYGQTGVVDLWD